MRGVTGLARGRIVVGFGSSARTPSAATFAGSWKIFVKSSWALSRESSSR